MERVIFSGLVSSRAGGAYQPAGVILNSPSPPASSSPFVSSAVVVAWLPALPPPPLLLVVAWFGLLGFRSSFVSLLCFAWFPLAGPPGPPPPLFCPLLIYPSDVVRRET